MEIVMAKTFAPPAAIFILGMMTLAPQASQAQEIAGLDTAGIEQASGLKGQVIAEEKVFKIGKPRTDVKIAVDEWSMAPFMGLGSWAAFTPGHGDAMTLAAGVKKVYDKIAEIRAANPSPVKSFPGKIDSPSSITAAPLEEALGVKGQSNQGMFKIVIGRTASMHGVSVGKEMGINTWAAFAGSDNAAFVDGDFAMLENELQPVLRAMRNEGINIVAIHQHMSHEQPRYLFLHYWGKGKAVDLARSLKRVLDVQASVKS